MFNLMRVKLKDIYTFSKTLVSHESDFSFELNERILGDLHEYVVIR